MCGVPALVDGALAPDMDHQRASPKPVKVTSVSPSRESARVPRESESSALGVRSAKVARSTIATRAPSATATEAPSGERQRAGEAWRRESVARREWSSRRQSEREESSPMETTRSPSGVTARLEAEALWAFQRPS